jgi:hypothetical protein
VQSWLWSYGSLIYDYLGNQCISLLTLWVRFPLRRCVLDTTLCDKVCQWLATGWWFFPGTSVFSTNKTDRLDTAEILLKVALNTITLTLFLGVAHHFNLLCCVFCFACLHSVYCEQCYMCLWTVQSCLPLRFSLTFISEHIFCMFRIFCILCHSFDGLLFSLNTGELKKHL